MQRPKTAAEIFAAAKPAPPKRQRQRAQTESVIPVAQMSMFSSSEPIVNPPSASSPARPTFQSGPAHSLNTVQFMTPLTQIRFEQKSGRADEGTLSRGNGGESRNSDILSHSDVPMSEPDAKAEVIERKPLISRIEEVLALLRGGRLSPFDLVLELLDEYNPEYSGYRTEFYKKENHLRDLCGICIFDEFRRKVADLLK